MLAPEGGTVYEIEAVARQSAAPHAPATRRWRCWFPRRRLPLGSIPRSRRAGGIAARFAEPRPPHTPFLASRQLRFRPREPAPPSPAAGPPISLASLENAAIERTIATGVEPSLVRFRQDGSQLITGNRPEHSVTIFDVSTGKTIVRLPLPLEPRHFVSPPTAASFSSPATAWTPW